MLGFVIGTIGLFGLVHTLRHRHRGPHGFGRGPGDAALYLTLERVRATPAQEKAIRQELDGLRRRFAGRRKALRDVRHAFAARFASDDFGVSSPAELTAPHEQQAVEVRDDVVQTLQRIHATLDEAQRQRLAQVLRDGPPWWSVMSYAARHHGPWARGHCGRGGWGGHGGFRGHAGWRGREDCGGPGGDDGGRTECGDGEDGARPGGGLTDEPRVGGGER